MSSRLGIRSGWKQATRGSGLVEVMVALLVFATAMTGLLLTHLEARRGAAEALQRSVATLLAQDLLERIRGNPTEAEIYSTLTFAGGTASLAYPERDCASSACTPLQLARYDLWHWGSRLLGLNERLDQRAVGGLASPDACVSLTANTVTLVLVWLGVSAAPAAEKLPCVIVGTGLYDDPEHPPGNNLLRRSLTITTGLEPAAP